jgi:hypothetical protein
MCLVRTPRVGDVLLEPLEAVLEAVTVVTVDYAPDNVSFNSPPATGRVPSAQRAPGVGEAPQSPAHTAPKGSPTLPVPSLRQQGPEGSVKIIW